MRNSRFTEGQIVGILKDGDDGVRLAELVRKHGISRATYFNWKRRRDGRRSQVDEGFPDKAKILSITLDPPPCTKTASSPARRRWRRASGSESSARGAPTHSSTLTHGMPSQLLTSHCRTASG
jgi:hypothetical protein